MSDTLESSEKAIVQKVASTYLQKVAGDSQTVHVMYEVISDGKPFGTNRLYLDSWERRLSDVPGVSNIEYVEYQKPKFLKPDQKTVNHVLVVSHFLEVDSTSKSNIQSDLEEIWNSFFRDRMKIHIEDVLPTRGAATDPKVSFDQLGRLAQKTLTETIIPMSESMLEEVGHEGNPAQLRLLKQFVQEGRSYSLSQLKSWIADLEDMTT